MFGDKSQELEFPDKFPYDVRMHELTHNTNTNMIYSDIQTTADGMNKIKLHSKFLRIWHVSELRVQ
jgi:hypothetical protein